MAGGKRGPKGRGKRVQHTLRTPEEHWAVYEEQARAAGLDVNAYIVARLAADHGLPEPAWARPPGPASAHEPRVVQGQFDELAVGA